MDDLNTEITSLMITFVCLGLLIVGLSVPMILRRVKPNPWYGFRTPRPLADESVWYAANGYSGRLLLMLGAIWAAGAVVLRYVPDMGTDFAACSIAYGVVITVGLLAVVGLSFRYLCSL